MQLPQKLRILFMLYCLLISCQNKTTEQNTSPYKSNTPSFERTKSTRPDSKQDPSKPSKKPTESEIKKKKIKQRDTLKPILVIP